MILSIDYGATTTDAIIFDGKNVVKKLSLPSTHYYSINDLKEKLNITPTKIAVTGGKDQHYHNATRVNEITAIGRGGAFLSEKKNCLVASMGTGTCIVHVQGNTIKHVSGSGVGGGTILGLSKLLTGITDFEQLNTFAQNGSLQQMDITVGEIIGSGIGIVPATLTASNFGKAQSNKKEDKILAAINLVAQSIAMLIIMTAKHCNEDTIVLTGKVTTMPLVLERMKETFAVYNKTFIVPQDADVGTAVGAAVSIL